MTKQVIWTKQFKKDYKLAMKRNLNIDLLDDIIRKIANDIPLSKANRDFSRWSVKRSLLYVAGGRTVFNY